MKRVQLSAFRRIIHFSKISLLVFVLTSCVVYQQPVQSPPSAYQPAPPPPPVVEQPVQQPAPVYQQPAPASSYQTFYDALSPYGQWVDYPNYGYVWIPTSAGPNFSPYSTNGYWVMTNYGWTWNSDYPWGWAPFHYGRWGYDNFYGWYWVPDNQWGPAWVSWRRSTNYYGWAPLAPGYGVNEAVGGSYRPEPARWVFVSENHFGERDEYNYYEPRERNEIIVNNTTIINNTYVDNSSHTNYVSGPRAEEVEKSTGRPVQRLAIKESSKPGQALNNNELSMYRPAILKPEESKQKPVPPKVEDIKNVKPPAERTVINQPANIKPRSEPTQNTSKEINQPVNNENRQVQKENNPNTGSNQNVQRATPSSQHSSTPATPANKQNNQPKKVKKQQKATKTNQGSQNGANEKMQDHK